MALLSSPHLRGPNSTAGIMQQVVLACVPGFLALSYFFGPGILYNMALAALTAVATEAAILKLRGRPIAFYLRDYSALLTAVLLGLALPPYAPWWIPVVGAASAIILAKQLYGGLGFNPFNPAMVGYVILLISFPVEMTQWAMPSPLLPEEQSLLGPVAALERIFLETPLDAVSGPTPLDLFKHQGALTVDQIYQQEPLFREARWAGAGWEWVNLAFLAGGVFLLYRRIISWHIPVSLLASLGLMAVLFYDGGSSSSGGPLLLHWLSGGTMLGAFFIATDPVTGPASPRGKLIFGASAGVLIYLIRHWGSYPDAVAFAVLLMNFAVPFIDYYTVPRSYGHAKSRPGR